MTSFVVRLETEMVGQVPAVLEAVFQCTLDMIAKDLESFPEHRLNFFLLLQVRAALLSFRLSQFGASSESS